MLKFLGLILLIVLPIELYASGDSTSVKHFNVDNGLPSNNVYAVTQDNLGYIWFNTDNGIAKYNGYSFRIFTVADGLPSNDIWKLFPDKRGRLWVGSFANKIGYIKDDKYHVLIRSSSNAIHPSFLNCNSDNVYFLYGTLGSMKLVRVDSANKAYVSSVDNGNGKVILNSISNDNVLVTVKSDSVVSTLDLSKVNAIPTSKKMKFSIWSYLASGENVEYYSGTLMDIPLYRNYILIIDSNIAGFKKIYFNQLGGGNDERIYISYSVNDSLIVHTDKAIYIFNHSFDTFRRISTSAIIPYSSQVSYYNTDDFRNEWFTTTSNGAWCKLNTKNIFNSNNSVPQLLDAKRIGLLKNGNTYWLSKKHNAVYELTPKNHISAISALEDEIPERIEDKSDSEFYICTDKGTYIYNIKRKSIISFRNYFSIDTILRYNQDLEAPVITDSVLIGASFMTVNWFHQIGSNKWLLYNSYPSLKFFELNNGVVKMVTLELERYNNYWYDNVDNLFFFTNLNKVAIYNPISYKYTVFNARMLNTLGINAILGIASDAYSNIYFLGNNKIVIFNVKANSISYIKCNFNLSDAFIYAYNNMLLVAGKFGIAFATINGRHSIGKFKVAANINSYNRIYDFVINAHGIIYLSTDKGLFSIQTNNLIKSEDLLDPTGIDFFKLVLNYPMHKRIVSNDTISVLQNSSKINFEVVNLFGKGNIEYSCIIDGVTEWQQSTTGELYIGMLRPNHYYKVRCIVNDDIWNSRQFTFFIYIQPYWWQTNRWIIIFLVFGAFLFIGFVLIVVLLTKHIVARSNEKKRVLTELELRAIYAQINPYFIFNTLNAALFFIKKKRFDDAYLHVNKFSRLIRGYLKASQDRYIILADEIEMLRNYIELQKTRFEEQFEYKMEIDNKLPIQNIRIPSLLLQPLVENALNHGLFYKKENGHLTIEFKQGMHSDELICIIEDNGVGREKSKEIKRKSAIERESYGTKLTKQLIDVFKEFENMDISLEYIDKQLPETGTIVKLTIKNIKYVA